MVGSELILKVGLFLAHSMQICLKLHMRSSLTTSDGAEGFSFEVGSADEFPVNFLASPATSMHCPRFRFLVM